MASISNYPRFVGHNPAPSSPKTYDGNINIFVQNYGKTIVGFGSGHIHSPIIILNILHLLN